LDKFTVPLPAEWSLCYAFSMARVATISVSLTPRQLRLVQERVASGGYESASEVIREGLSVLFNKSQSDVCKPSGRLRDP
jgi:hypothetical protein